MALEHRRFMACLSIAVLAHALLLAGIWSPGGGHARTLLKATRAVGPVASASNPTARAAHNQRGDDPRSQRARRAAPASAAQPSAVRAGAPAITRFVVVADRPARDTAANDPSNERRAPAQDPRPARSRSAARDARAAYLAAWQQRIEALGDRRYPARLFTPDQRRRLTLAVRLDSAGHLRALRIMHSSGSAKLDAVAVRIVRQAAPFPHFGPRLARHTSEITFAYDWIFQPSGARRLRPAG